MEVSYSNPAGNLYGTTSLGGNGANCGSSGCGTIFKITPQTLAEDSGQDAQLNQRGYLYVFR